MGGSAPQAMLPQNTALEKEIRIAEFRANEFMGSLLVPRDRLVELAVARAPDCDVGIDREGCLSDELHAATPRLVEQGTFGFLDMENLQQNNRGQTTVFRRE